LKQLFARAKSLAATASISAAAETLTERIRASAKALVDSFEIRRLFICASGICMRNEKTPPVKAG
jgi:hypothetical protein